jgi:hypothetical protein
VPASSTTITGLRLIVGDNARESARADAPVYLPPAAPPVGLAPEFVMDVSPEPPLPGLADAEPGVVLGVRVAWTGLFVEPVAPTSVWALEPPTLWPLAPIPACALPLPRLLDAEPVAVTPVLAAPGPLPAPCAIATPDIATKLAAPKHFARVLMSISCVIRNGLPLSLAWSSPRNRCAFVVLALSSFAMAR